ncbi:MAG: discoidin domain-containing protein [Oscillospiraceae bacterium]|nr:discoidin domain-containing protein [Oscillospiraceae bacterium]
MRRNNRSKFLALFLSLALTIQLLPAVALAAEGTGDPLVKETGYQDFPAYYSDSAHADNQVTHPDVVVLDEEWNGYRYWAVYTPNVMNISIYENPSIVASDDGVHWVEPEGLSNPIEPQPPNTRYHNCDADMLYNAEMDAMMAYWNWADDQAGGVGAEMRLRISYDGIHWGIPVTYDAETRVWTKPANASERQVDDGPNGFITAIASAARYDMLSPTIVYDDFRDVFIMWANDTGDVGYNNGQSNRVRMWYSKDGITWGDPVRVNNFLGQNEDGQQLAPWHQDVQYVSELKEFICISQCFSGRNPDGSVLHLTKSKDGVNWEQVGNKAILSPGEDGSWDDFQIYRSSFYYEPGSAAGNGTMRVWYSALQKNTANKMVPDSSGNLTIQAKSGDSRIWRIGYAQNGYEDMMRALLNDPGYTVPALVPGTALNLTSSLADGTLPVGETTALQIGFIPSDTSDQVVKFTSSDPAVAAVNEHGIIMGVSVGEAVITGETREGLIASINLSVVSNPYTLIPQSSMTATATSVYGGSSEGPASNVLDGDLNTIWHTNYNPKDELPQSLTVTFDRPRTVGKYAYTPRQAGTNGMVTQYELYAVLADGTKVQVAAGSWDVNADEKFAVFNPIEAAALELKVLAGAGGFGTAAEINVYAYGDIGPDPGPVPQETIVDDRDSALVYTGTWHDDSSSAFHAGTARYTNEENASVALTFVGSTIRWYGQKDTNFGTANVYIDGELVGEVNAYGSMAAGQLLFEQAGLAEGEHTIRIVRLSGVIDLDYFSYA